MFKCRSRRIEASPVRIGVKTVRKKVICFDWPSRILIAYCLCVTARRRVKQVELPPSISVPFEFVTMPEFNEIHLIETIHMAKILKLFLLNQFIYVCEPVTRILVSKIIAHWDEDVVSIVSIRLLLTKFEKILNLNGFNNR